MTDAARPIDTLTTCPVPFDRAREVVLEEPRLLFRKEVREKAAHPFVLDLTLDVAAGASIHHDVVVQLGVPFEEGMKLVVPVEWRGSGLEHLVPVFEGQLELSPSGQETKMALVGGYTVPLGVVGRFGDGVIGWRLARRTFEALADRLSARLEEEGRIRSKRASAPVPMRVRQEGHPGTDAG